MKEEKRESRIRFNQPHEALRWCAGYAMTSAVAFFKAGKDDAAKELREMNAAFLSLADAAEQVPPFVPEKLLRSVLVPVRRGNATYFVPGHRHSESDSDHFPSTTSLMNVAHFVIEDGRVIKDRDGEVSKKPRAVSLEKLRKHLTDKKGMDFAHGKGRDGEDIVKYSYGGLSVTLPVKDTDDSWRGEVMTKVSRAALMLDMDMNVLHHACLE